MIIFFGNEKRLTDFFEQIWQNREQLKKSESFKIAIRNQNFVQLENAINACIVDQSNTPHISQLVSASNFLTSLPYKDKDVALTSFWEFLESVLK